MQKVKWTPERVEELHKLWNGGKTDQEIADIFGTTAYAISRKRVDCGFVNRNTPHRKWTDAEVELLKKLAQDHSCAEVARIMNRPVSSIRDKADKLHIIFNKSNHYVFEPLSEEYVNIGHGRHRGYTTTTDMLIVQFLSEGYSLSFIASELNRDYKNLQQYCKENAERLRKAHFDMLGYDGIYANRLTKNKREGLS